MAVRFKMNEDTLRKLLVGEMVKLEGAQGVEVEFFLEDIGLFQLQQVFDESIEKVTANLTGG